MADIHVRLPDELQRRFKVLCAKSGYSMSWAIRTLMIKAINDAAIGEGLLGENNNATPRGAEEE